MKRSIIAALSGWLLAPAAFAILDSNNNGLSDLWEKKHNSGALFPASFDPQADADSDGWTNEQEENAGTNPFVPNPPDGILRPFPTHYPAELSEPDEYGDVYVIYPETVTVSWPTQPGKQYTLFFSDDLSQDSWLPVGSPFIANGGESVYGFDIEGEVRGFWRVTVEDVDSDSDGLNNHEESLAGTNAYGSDSDFDTISDWDELVAGMNPLTQDSDGDGIPDPLDAQPAINNLYFVDWDGDGIADGDDAFPNDPRGDPPYIHSENTIDNPFSNLIQGEVVEFAFTVSNPAGAAPVASNLTFYLNGAEEPATITPLGGAVGSSQSFVLSWIAETTADYPTLTVQNLTLRFQDSDLATSWLNLARIDVAEWEGKIISLPNVISGEGDGWLYELMTHEGGVKAKKFLVNRRSGTNLYYRGPKTLKVSNLDTENVVDVALNDEAIPFLIISGSTYGDPVIVNQLDYATIATGMDVEWVLNNNSNKSIQFELTDAGINATLSPGESHLGQTSLVNATFPLTTGVYKRYLAGSDWITYSSSVWQVAYTAGANSRILRSSNIINTSTGQLDQHTTNNFMGRDVKITPYASGNWGYPGLPLPSATGNYSYEQKDMVIGSEEWRKVVIKIFPYHEQFTYSRGYQLNIGTGTDGNGAPQDGWAIQIENQGEVEELEIPANGQIEILPPTSPADPESELHRQLTSPEGLVLYVRRDSLVDQDHSLSLDILPIVETNDSVRLGTLGLVPLNVEFIDVESGELVQNLKSSNIASSIQLNDVSLAHVTVDAEAGDALVEVSGTVEDPFEALTGETPIDTIYATTGQEFEVVDGAFSGTLRVPLASADVRVELETGKNVAGRKAMVALTLNTDFVPVPPPSINPTITETQYDGFSVELADALDVTVADTIGVSIRGAEGVHFPAVVLNESEIDTLVADVFGRRLSLDENAVASLRFTTQDPELGHVVLQFNPADFASGQLPTSAAATISAQNMFGGETMAYRFEPYKDGHTAYQSYRILSLVETAANSMVFQATSPDYGALEFTMTTYTGTDPLLIDSMDGTLTWTIPVGGSSDAELVETTEDSGVYVSAEQLWLAAQQPAGGDSMLIVAGVESDGLFHGGKESIYRMRISKIDDGANQTHITFTDTDTGATRQIELEEDEDADWLITQDFALLDIDPKTVPVGQPLLAGTSPQLVWAAQVNESESSSGETSKMGVRVLPNPTMDEEYEWEEGKFFSGPFWLWGEDLIFDADANGQRDFLKEGKAASEGIIELKLANNFDRIKVEVFEAQKDAEGELVRDTDGKPMPVGDALYEGAFDNPNQVKFNRLEAGIHRFWDGRVNRIKDGPKAIPTYVPGAPPALENLPIVLPNGKVWHVENYDPASQKVKMRLKDENKEYTADLSQYSEENQQKILDWTLQYEADVAAHNWEQTAEARADAHPYFLDPAFGECLVRVTGEYTEDGVVVPISGDGDILVQAYAKKLIAYVGRDQAFDEEARQTFQLATDILCYQHGGLVKPPFVEGKFQDDGGKVLRSRHMTQSEEARISSHVTVVDLDRDEITFHELFMRLTQRGELAIFTHGTTNQIRLENLSYQGFKAKNNPTNIEFSVSPYPLPVLGLNTVSVYLHSCHSGTKLNGTSLATNVLEILNSGLNPDATESEVVGFNGVSITDAEPYKYRSKFALRADRMTPEKYKLNSGLVDEWQNIIENSGVESPEPIASYEPFNGSETVKMTEFWSSDIALNTVDEGDGAVAIGNQYTTDHFYEFYFPEGDPILPVELEIWEAPLTHAGSNSEGEKRGTLSYIGIGSILVPEVSKRVPIAQLSGTDINLLQSPLVTQPNHALVLRSPGRGGHAYFMRYCLQIEMEQGMQPDENGNPGGDRMELLRNQFEGITVLDKKATEFADLIFNTYLPKLGEGEYAVTETE